MLSIAMSLTCALLKGPQMGGHVMPEAGGWASKELQARIACQAITAESVVAGAPTVKRLIREESLKEEGARTEQVLKCIWHAAILYAPEKAGDISKNAY
jgi:hypothetical protein